LIMSGVSKVRTFVGSDVAAAITSTGALYIWGSGSLGQIGDNAALSRSSPVLVMSGHLALELADTGGSVSCPPMGPVAGRAAPLRTD
jgi:alpha-tubulin suppressor-like RCC1 family protein